MASVQTPRKIQLVFFRNERGSEPVRDWLRDLDQGEDDLTLARKRQKELER
jgi:hypothetical protein